ncbi:MAG: SGNH/GDSL hydrolase family protein [Bacteroidaceae bacterium]|nr:SGNH/GDSL hydrolase family protein [Bacteroidaceae bacterium]
MKKLSLFILFFAVIAMTANAQKKVSILGDSYSTFKGHIQPDVNEPWYPQTARDKDGKLQNDVQKVEQTWWRVLLDNNKDKYVLEKNNSYSGATISCHGYKDQSGKPEDYCYRSYNTRCVNLGNPDIILIFGATNDSWAGAEVGDYQYANFTKQDLWFFRPALAQLLQNVQMYYPKAQIYYILNSELREEINESIYTLCKTYHVPVITLHDIEKQWGHPSIKGMKAIAEQVQLIIDNQ